ncbi:MAG: cupin domain-containing protein [Paracoccaceae bacterium]|nr:cupin domain-containing protein [Paracoccaceae bacterium]
MTRKGMDKGKDVLDWLDLASGGETAPGDELPGTRPDLAETFSDDQAALAALAALAPAAEPPKNLLSKIEKRIDKLPKRKITNLRSDEGEWVKRKDKIWQKILNKDPETGRAIYLLRCAPGAVIPPHPHPREEHVFVIEGSFTIGDTLIRAGDYHYSKANTLHGTIRSETGCLVLIHC